MRVDNALLAFVEQSKLFSAAISCNHCVTRLSIEHNLARAGKRLKERFVTKTRKIFLAQLVCRVNNAFARNRIQNIKNHVSRNGSRFVEIATNVKNSGNSLFGTLPRNFDTGFPFSTLHALCRQFVYAAKRWLIVSSNQLSAHAPRSNFGTRVADRLDGKLVQIIRKNHAGLGKARLIKHGTSLLGIPRQIARIDADAC